MDDTKKFISLAQNIYKLDRDNANIPEEWLLMMSKFSKGICGSCNKTLKVVKIENNFQGKKFFFECGHIYSLMRIDDKTTKIRDPNLTFRKSSVPFHSASNPHIVASHSGPAIKIDHDELAVSRRFIEVAYPEYQTIKKYPEQASLIDVIAKTKNDSNQILIQDTKLYPSNFWKDLNTKGKAETNEEIFLLIKNTLKRKKDFDKKEKEKIILLIDSWPGFDKSALSLMSKGLKDELATSGYKEIWIVGLLKNCIFKIF